MNIHPKAWVDDTIKVGKDTHIWQFATVIRNSVLGEGCNVWPYALIDRSYIGDRSVVASGVVLGGGFKIGNDCFLGPMTMLCNDVWPAAHKEGFDESRFLDDDFWTVIVEDNVAVGAQALILPGVRIGQNSVIAAGATVKRSVPPFHLLKRNGQTVPLEKRGPRLKAAT